KQRESVDFHLQLGSEIPLRADGGRPERKVQRPPSPEAHHVEVDENRQARADDGEGPEQVGALPPREAEDRGSEGRGDEDRLREEDAVAGQLRGLRESPGPSLKGRRGRGSARFRRRRTTRRGPRAAQPRTDAGPASSPILDAEFRKSRAASPRCNMPPSRRPSGSGRKQAGRTPRRRR